MRVWLKERFLNMPSYEEAVEQALASVAHGGLIHEALEIYHPTFNGQPQRIINAHQEEMFTLESDAPFDAGQTVTFYPCLLYTSDAADE